MHQLWLVGVEWNYLYMSSDTTLRANFISCAMFEGYFYSKWPALGNSLTLVLPGSKACFLPEKKKCSHLLGKNDTRNDTLRMWRSCNYYAKCIPASTWRNQTPSRSWFASLFFFVGSGQLHEPVVSVMSKRCSPEPRERYHWSFDIVGTFDLTMTRFKREHSPTDS